MANLTSGKLTNRLFFVDHLRAALIILVVLHHLAFISPLYLEPAYQGIGGILLLLFLLVNQAYFMGFFFLISGYFTPGSFDRKGPASYLKDRLLRLGIPTLLYTFILNPIAAIGLYVLPASLTGITTPLTWQQYPKMIGIGPMWFAIMLLVFDFSYVAWRLATKNRVDRPATTTNPRIPTYRVIAVFILVVGLASYLVRIDVPLVTYVFSFPTLSYLPQYASFFIVGIVAFHRNWFRTIPNSMGMWGFRAALVSTLILLPLALSSKTAFLGRGYWPSGAYALWDATFSVGMCLGLITLFRRFFDRPGRLGWFLSQHTYAVYVFHFPVVVLLALALRDIQLVPLLKFGLAAIIGVPFCFAVAYLVRKIPFMDRIL
jgi:fucose 4-O-acetylase-like acetyltransferase